MADREPDIRSIPGRPRMKGMPGTRGVPVIGSRAALFAGFATLLILMAIICVDSLQTLTAFETNDAQIRKDFLYRERTLDQVRAGLYESASFISDYTSVESDSRAVETLRMKLEAVHNETSTELAACIQSLPPNKKEAFQRLDAELGKYWSMAQSILTASEQAKPSDVQRRDMLAEHAEVLAITKEVSTINDADLQETDRRIAEISVQFRRRLLIVGLVASALGLILAATTFIYVGRLETNISEKYRESLRAQGEMKELSRRLVDTEERERRTISRELHDEVGQSLSALLLDVESLIPLKQVSGDDASFQRRIQDIKALAENSVNQVRDMALLLRPSMLDDLGLVPAIEWQTREVSKRTGMIIDTVDENVSENLPDEHKTCAYRVVQEALNNCAKHSGAKNVRVSVRQEANRLRVSIQDDGRGFDSSRVRGMGLVGMNERVSRLGGTLNIESEVMKGTRVLVDLPLSGSGINPETSNQ